MIGTVDVVDVAASADATPSVRVCVCACVCVVCVEATTCTEAPIVFAAVIHQI